MGCRFAFVCHIKRCMCMRKHGKHQVSLVFAGAIGQLHLCLTTALDGIAHMVTHAVLNKQDHTKKSKSKTRRRSPSPGQQTSTDLESGIRDDNSDTSKGSKDKNPKPGKVVGDNKGHKRNNNKSRVTKADMQIFVNDALEALSKRTSSTASTTAPMAVEQDLHRKCLCRCPNSATHAGVHCPLPFP